MNEVIEFLWQMDTVDEPVLARPKRRCVGTYEKTECDNTPVLATVWQACVCSHRPRTWDFCIDCYNFFPTKTLGDRAVKCGKHVECGMTVYMLSASGIG